ncbi:RHS repeat domain-containing protein [Lacrimispora sphenoides]|uniref:RHS repeat-associated core domain-containing protein n=1 Tax=Lacrimispora sphenoides JCM 1415 TaxID=1297793 RepID=A0ABY1CD33_9FIRM|nr:RHS repeat-associated core domain-containing protein [Lacrimispora sphenoides]SET91941.1 RHS repeat-associated core domain-containing protein [[Clostridium] sphenoides JCM 1415]SUY52353.1 YD repeat protein [Lacrimispora sphenoides]
MNDNKNIEDYIDKNEWEETDTKAAEDVSGGVENEAKGRETLFSRAALPAEEEEFSDIKEYPESPFTYFETNQVNVKLNTGTVQYETTDFVLPGRDGFDVSIARRYDSGCANLVDMDPYVKSEKLKTGSKDNSFYTSTYGLGYGWSFILPSIETVPYLKCSKLIISYDPPISTLMGTPGFDYVLHLEDGRSLKISRSSDRFLGYGLKDVSILTSSGTIKHPYANIAKSYDIIIEYKNGNKDYFKNLCETVDDRNGLLPQKFTLTARQDKFGNTIFYDLRSYGGMKIVDTWGRSINLEKTDDGLIWKLPESTAGKACELSYHIDQAQPLKLTAVTDPEGRKTNYNYYNQEEFSGSMSYASKEVAGNTTANMPRKYLLLKSVTYPNHASTQFTYGRKIGIESEAGGIITHFVLTMKVDIFNGAEYNRGEYKYTLDSGVDSSKGKYIKFAEVTNHQDIEETHQFNSEGQLKKKEIRHQESLISTSDYTYSNKLIVLATDKIFDRNDQSKFLQKETTWEYSEDKKANVIKHKETYMDDPSSDQEIITEYGDYSTILKTERIDGTDQIIEKNKLHKDLGNRVIKYHKVYENGVLKEKTEYDYKDNVINPYCVTNERKYFLADSGNLEQSGEYAETIYKYSSPASTSSRYTHKAISKEQTDIRDADGKLYDPIKEEFQYDNWGRLIYKKDSRNQVTTYCYDQLGRMVEEKLPPIDGKQTVNETDYNDNLNYITTTDGNHQKKRIQYTPFGQIQQVCLAVSKEPASGDVVLQDFRYNSWGELTEAITYDGNGTAPANIRKTERYTYDSFGRVLSRRIPQVGYEETYEYNEVFTDPRDSSKMKYHREVKKVIGDASSPDIVTECYKDQKDQVRKEFLAGERLFTYEYDNAGNNISKIDARNKTERFEYDYAGRVVKSIRTDFGQNRITSIQYDALGNKRFQWDEAGKKTEFQYDKAGRLVKTIAPFDNRSQTVKYYYDGAGNIIWEKKAQKDAWQETQYVYDARNRLTDTYQYLSPGNWIKTTCRYDAMNQVILRRTGDTPSGEGREVTKYIYDCFGNVTAMTDARGCKEYYEYDKVGRLQKKTDRNKDQTVYQHDALGRLIKETVQKKTPDGMAVSEREYAYGKNGKRIREVSRESVGGKQTVLLEAKYRYNPKGQLIRQDDPGNIKKEYTYDIYGNRQSFQLTREGNASADLSLYYAYDDLYRLKQVRKNNAAGVILAEYEYDEKGNRKTLRYPQSGMETIYQYNDGNRVISLENKRQGTVISAWEYGYDVDGNILNKINKAGSAPVAISYQYDRLGRLTEEDYSDWKRTFYTYDVYSNRVKMMVEGRTKDELVSVTNYEYGLNNRLEKETKKQGKTTETYRYRYDDNGNEIFRIWEKTSPTPDYPGNVKLSGYYQLETPTVYEWRHYNGFNQLSLINQDEKEILYQYRGDGLRHSTLVRKLNESQGKTNLYCWDRSDIVAEQTDGEKIKTYIRGINLIAREIDRVVYYYILNEHGDVTQLWSQSGTCKALYEYDAFGVERTPDKEDENPFRYCGEYFDLSSSTYYLRARDYRSSTGRFLAEDSIEKTTRKMPNDQEITDPLSLNKYTYCHNNPIVYNDPTGHLPFLVLAGLAGLAAGAIAGGISSAIQGKFSLEATVQGAAIGSTVGLTGGAGLAYGVTGSALASTGAVASGLGFGVATGFEQARQLLQSQQMRAIEGAGTAKGLIGKDFEDFLTKKIGGYGSFSIGGRDFDGGLGNRWWEAKSGQYWNMLESNPNNVLKFKSDMGDRLKIAIDNGATYELFSNTSIPQTIKDWLTKKGIPFTEILK